MAAAGSEQRELLALMHQHLVQTGYKKAAKELLEQSGQKTFPSSTVPLKDIFIQWKKGSLQTAKRKADDIDRGAPAKIRVPDPKSSSESSEEEEASNVIKTNLPVNNSSSMAKAESSSEDEDSSSEEEAVAGKTVKTPVTNKTDFLQLAAQKTDSFPGKGVAVAAVQAKGRQNKATSNKPPPPPPTAAKAGQNKVLSGKQGPASQTLVAARQNTAQAATAKKAVSSGSGSSSSESEEEETLPVVKIPPPKLALQKPESSSEDSSDDSDSEEEESNAAAVQVKPAVQSAQVNTTLAKRLPATPVPSKGNAVKVSPAKTTANQIRAGSVNAARSTKPTDSSETSDSSDSGDDEPLSAAQTQSPRKPPQAFTVSVKNAPSSLPSNKAVSTPAPLKQTSSALKQAPKPSVATLVKPLPPAKAVGSAKKAESSESSESSSESETGNENEAPTIPVSQKRLQTSRPPAGAKQNLADKPGTPVKATSSALKGKEAASDSSSSSDSEDETVPAAHKLPPPSAKANATPQPACPMKPQPQAAPLPKAQASEDSSQDSSDESDSEEDTVFTQKPAQVTRKPAPTAVRALATKSAVATPGKAGNAQAAGKGAASPAKSAAASLREASESSETDSSDSSEGKETVKPVKPPPIHPFFKQMTGKAAVSSGKGVQANSGTTDSISSKCQGPATVTTGKVEQSPSKKAKPSQGQALPAKPTGVFARKEGLGSSSSSDSEEEEAAALTTAKQIPKPGTPQKQGVIKEPGSSSEESSDGDQESSQSLLKGVSVHLKVPASTVVKSASPVPPKQSSGKTGIPVISALAKPSGKASPADSSSSDNSDSDTDAEETVGEKAAGIGSLPSSGRETVVAKASKGAAAGKRGPGVGSKASTAKKSTAKAQSNGRAKGTAAVQLPLPSKACPAGVSSESEEEAVAHVPAAGAPEDTQASPVVAAKTSKTTKSSKAGVKEKPSKRRKLAAGDAGVGEPEKKKLKVLSDLEKPAKKKKTKKKSKAPSGTKTPKQKDGKEKKSKKKKKSKKVASLTEDESQKKKKKKKKTGDLEGMA